MWSLFPVTPERPRNKFSLENLKYLYTELVKHESVQNKDVVVETLRLIAEVMIWGDQHNPGFFDFFCEKNIIGFFLKILQQKTSAKIKVQLLQTLSILVQNLASQNAIFYLLSNNHINDLIVHRFDFSDEELLSYYISFLKTLSFKVNVATLPFFFNERANDFPLYTEAIKFFNHDEDMVRAAVRTLTLNIYSVDDPGLRAFILDRSAVPYFSNLVWFIRDQCLSMDKFLQKASYLDVGKVKEKAEHQIDHFYYLQDIFNLQVEAMNRVLTDQLLAHFVFPVLVGSCIATDEEDESVASELSHRISSHFSIFLLAQMFHIFRDNSAPLINALASCLLHPFLSTLAASLIKDPPPYPVLSTQPIATIIIHASLPASSLAVEVPVFSGKKNDPEKEKNIPEDENVKNPRSKLDEVGPVSSPIELISNYMERSECYYILFIMQRNG